MKTKNVLLTLRVRMVLIAMSMLFAVGVIGCVDSKTESQPNNPATKTIAGKGEDDDDHSGWWCNPHGLPEAKCWKCDHDYRDKCRKDGDWCDMHLRPKSQCFKCDPTLIDKWAKVYEAKEGKLPPKPKPNY